jgi:hypothetical protein
MATKSPLSMYAETPEDEKVVQEYRDQQKMLMDSLVNRKQLFDPTLLAISQALGAPTRTGSFGEVIGNVAGAIGPVQQAEEKRSQEIAKMRFDMAQQNYMMNRKDQAARMLAPPKLDATAGVPAAGAPSADGVPTAPASPIAGGAPSVVPKPAALSRFSHITPELILEIGLKDPDLAAVATKYLEAVNAQKKFDQDAFRSNERGTTQIGPQFPNGFKFTPNPGRALVNRFLAGTGNLELNEQDAENFDNVKDILSRKPDDQAAQAELARLVGKYRGASKVVGAGSQGSATSPQSPADVEAERKQKDLIAELKIKEDAELRKALISKSVSSSNMIPTFANIERFAQTPDASKLMGVFEGSSFGQALAKIIEPTIPQIRDAVTQYALDKGLKADQGLILQQMAVVNADIRKALRAPGEGAQSDMENRAAFAAGLDKTDTPGSMVKKVRFLKAQAEFQRDVGRELNKSKLGPTDFLLSDDYDKLLQIYEQKLTRVLGLAPQQIRPPASNPSGNNSKARDQLNKRLGLPS